MKDVIWHWTKGSSRVFTSRAELAAQAESEGFIVTRLEKKHMFS